MNLLDRLRGQPDWQHADPAVRASAVDGLDDDAQDLFEAIATEDADASVRLAAVARLSAPAVILRVAENDQDERVRREAALILRELFIEATDVDEVGAALSGLSDERDLTDVAREARCEAISRMALEQLKSSKALGAVARRSSHRSVRDAALARLDDRDEIVAVAVKSDHRDIALAAFDRLDPVWPRDEVFLKMIAVRSRTKAVSRRAKLLMDSFSRQPAAPTADEIESQREKLCERLEALAQQPNWQGVNEGLAKAEREWQVLDDLQRPLGSTPTPPGQGSRQGEQPPESSGDKRWTHALELVHEHLARLDVAREEVDRGRDVRRVSDEARAALCERVAKLLGNGAQEPATRMAALVAAQAEWDALTNGSSSDDTTGREGNLELTHRFEELVASVKKQAEIQRMAIEQAGRLGELAQTLEGLSESSETEALTIRWKRSHQEWIDCLESFPAAEVGDLTARVQAAQAKRDERVGALREERRRREQVNLAKQQSRCSEIEHAVASESLELREAEQKLRLTRSLLGNLGQLPTRDDRASLTARLQAAKSALNGRLRELRGLAEWKQWANVGVQAALCQRLEKLASVDDDVNLAKQFKVIVSEWGQASDIPRGEGEALWQRFKMAHDAVYERVQAQLSRDEVQRRENITQKAALCEEAERLVESTDWVKTAQRLTDLQEQWKQVGAGPQKQEREVWNRFRAATGRFFKRRRDDLVERKQVWTKNAALKEELCGKAEALTEEMNLDAAKATVRRLQGEWKQVGPVRRSRSDGLWRRFRAACDNVYTRAQEAVDAQFTAQISARVSLCERIELLTGGKTALAEAAGAEETGGKTEPAETAGVEETGGKTESAEAPSDLTDTVMKVREEWRQLPVIPQSQGRNLTRRFETAITQVVERYPAAFVGTSLDPERNLPVLERLCRQVEALLEQEEGSQGTEASPAEILARQLREALATNTMGARVDPEIKRKTDVDLVRRCQSERRALGSMPTERGQRLSERFREACDRFSQRQSSAPPAESGSKARPRNRRSRSRRDAGTGKTP